MSREEHAAKMELIKTIVYSATKKPTIINPDSKFVVVTYWWGRGNFNTNLARPCVAFFELFFQYVLKFVTNILYTIYIGKNKNETILRTSITQLETILNKYSDYKNKVLIKKANDYLVMIYELCGINLQNNSKNTKATICLEDRKPNRTPTQFIYKQLNELLPFFHNLVLEFIHLNRESILTYILLIDKNNELKSTFTELSNANNTSILNRIKREQSELLVEKNRILSTIKNSLRERTTFDRFPTFPNKNLLDILNDELRYIKPLKFEEMIANWETSCAKYNCNYLAIEYPQFSEPGGYQLAINAKPLFIRRALELCEGRAVLYIDGDMFIRKYPSLFDIEDVDFMARGWWIDPRASYKLTESIMYDPYTFETSGGIMYFSQSDESNKLLDTWITIAKKYEQRGKADDRILSLVFNSYKFLLNCKLIQLPIEYLWLTLDYNERMMEVVYDYDATKMRSTIFVEHPECLTSEETAEGAGASSDRTPKYYSFLGDYMIPVSEEMHESIMFPNQEMTNSFRDYFKYMTETQYIDDGNEELVKRGLIHPENPDENEYPIYLTAYKDKLGNKPSADDKSLTTNQLSEIMFKRAKTMNAYQQPFLYKLNDTLYEIRPESTTPEPILISLILRLLLDGNQVLYNPVKAEGYNSRYYTTLVESMDTKYKGLEFVFKPILTSTQFSDYFKPLIDSSQAMLFRPGNRILLDYLSMFATFDSFSTKLHTGAYEFISRVRVGYSILKKVSGGTRKRKARRAMKQTRRTK